MILVDSNIPMYLVGASHPHKLDAQRLLESALSGGERLVTDAEVLQEICHRYVAIKRREAIQPLSMQLSAWSTKCCRSSAPMSNTRGMPCCAIKRCRPGMHYTSPSWLTTTLPADELRPWVRLLSGDQASGLIRNHTAAMSGTDVAGAAPGGMLSGQNGSNGIVVGRPPHPYDRCGHCVALPASEHAGCRGADRA